MTYEYNIDTLRVGDSYEFNLATRGTVRGALERDHVTHLQRYERTVAMRKTANLNDDGNDWFYTLDFNDRTCQQFTCLNTAMDAVIEYLNQGEHDYEAGDSIAVWCNQAQRDATVLAVIGREIVVEVEMPNGTSFLVRYEVGYGARRNALNYSYNSVPKKWLRAINLQSGGWIGMGQGMAPGRPLSLDTAMARC
jgi:hypothetical protein